MLGTSFFFFGLFLASKKKPARKGGLRINRSLCIWLFRHKLIWAFRLTGSSLSDMLPCKTCIFLLQLCNFLQAFLLILVPCCFPAAGTSTFWTLLTSCSPPFCLILFLGGIRQKVVFDVFWSCPPFSVKKSVPAVCGRLVDSLAVGRTFLPSRRS